MIYASYSYYKNEYYGVLDNEQEFNRLAVRASAYLDYITMGKAKGVAELDALKKACCALVDKYSAIDAVISSIGKKSETVGSYSVTYQTAAEVQAAEKEMMADLAAIARMHLAGTNLLYRGGCSCVCSSHGNSL